MRLGAILLAVPFAAGAVSAGKTEASPRWEGRSYSGVVTTDPCGVEMEKETIALDVPDLPPADGFSGEAEFSAYASRVTVSYTFRNPAETDATLKLYFPFGRRPAYLAPCCDDFSRYTVETDGEPVAAAVRHTYQWDGAESAACFAAADGFYAQDPLAVTETSFRIDVPENGDCKYAYFVLLFECDPAETRVMSPDRFSSLDVVNGMGRACFSLGQGENEIAFCAVGRPAAIVGYSVCADRDGNEPIEGASVTASESVRGFREFALASRPADSAVSEEDWFRGYASRLSRGTVNGCMVYADCDGIAERDFMRWFEYEVVVPAGGTAVNTVSAPLYPSVEEGRYSYECTLSSARSWRFGNLEIRLRTPYFVCDSSLEFGKTDAEYLISRDRLPMSDLTFTLALTDPASADGAGEAPSPSKIALYVFCGVLGAAAAGVLAAVAVHFIRKRKGEKEEAMRRYRPPEDRN